MTDKTQATKYTSTFTWSVCEHDACHYLKIPFLLFTIRRFYCPHCHQVFTVKQLQSVRDFQKRMKNKSKS